MSRRRTPRSVRKKLWRLLGFASPREHRLDREAAWRAGAPIRRAITLIAEVCALLVEAFAAAAPAIVGFYSSLLSLRKDDAHAFS